MREKSKKGWYKKIKLNNELFENNQHITIKKIFGEKGTSFLEDTSCFHRGTKVMPNHQERIIFQVLFTPWNNEKDITMKIKKPEWLEKFKDRSEVNYALKDLFIS